jgi:long-chain fatty acid transport protein
MTAAPMVSRLFFYSAAIAVVAGVAMAPKAQAAAFYLQDQSVKGMGRAYSGEVSDTGAESLWYNPASIAGSANEMYIGGNAVLTSSTVSDSGTTITGPFRSGKATGAPRAEDPVLFGVVPNSAGSFRLNDRIALGLSFAAPYDFITQYDGNSAARYDSLKARLTSIDGQLTVAAKVTDWLDLGVGFNTEYMSANLAQAYPGLLASDADGNLDLKGSGYDYGYSLGAQVHHDRWSFGASYKSAITHTLDGRVELELTGLAADVQGANTKADGNAKLTTPWIATFGARYALTDKLTLNAQVERFGWSEFHAIQVSAGPVLSQSIVQGYRDTTSGAVGVDYAVTNRWIMRAGVGYDQSPTQTRYRNSFVPDSDRMLYTLGTSFKATPRMTIDASGAYYAFRGSNIDYSLTDYAGTVGATNVTERAHVSGDAKILSLGVRYAY